MTGFTDKLAQEVATQTISDDAQRIDEVTSRLAPLQKMQLAVAYRYVVETGRTAEQVDTASAQNMPHAAALEDWAKVNNRDATKETLMTALAALHDQFSKANSAERPPTDENIARGVVANVLGIEGFEREINHKSSACICAS